MPTRTNPMIAIISPVKYSNPELIGTKMLIASPLIIQIAAGIITLFCEVSSGSSNGDPRFFSAQRRRG